MRLLSALKGQSMSDGSTEVAVVGIGIKSGLAASMVATTVAVLAVAIGFTIVPLRKGHETKDAGQRLAAGLFCSFTLGPLFAFKAIDAYPWLLKPWESVLHGEQVLWVYLAASAPFIAVTAVFGFWVMAAAMRFFVKRQDKDIAEITAEIRRQLGQ